MHTGFILSAADLLREPPPAADSIVVGSGAGGAVVAALLAERGERVVILEEGEHVAPERYARMRPSETMRHMWRDGGIGVAFGLGDSPLINVMSGRCVGGSSVLTGGVCFRTPGHVHAEWERELGLSELSERALEPYYEVVERDVHVETVPDAMRSRSTLRFVEGAERIGLGTKSVRRNTRDCRGCGRCNFGCPEGAKLSVDVTYLPRAAKAGAVLFAGCHVERVLVEQSRASGVLVRVSREGRRHRVRLQARRVIVAAGALGSPLLLKRSGLGRRSQQVGRNLTLHPGFRVMARFEELIEGWKGALQSAYSDQLMHEGLTLVGMFVPPGVLAATLPGVGPTHRAMARSVPHLAVFGGMIHDSGGGRVDSWFGHPLLTYRMASADRARIPKLLKLMAQAFFAAGAREVFLPILGLGGVNEERLASLDLERIPAARLECSSQHPLGSCRMGRSPRSSVVDTNGQTWELPGLYVADGSIMPTSLGVNPQESIMAMAARIADRMPRI